MRGKEEASQLHMYYTFIFTSVFIILKQGFLIHMSSFRLTGLDEDDVSGENKNGRQGVLFQ
jgi:hypothetical protein